jgi:hypothetical protein
VVNIKFLILLILTVSLFANQNKGKNNMINKNKKYQVGDVYQYKHNNNSYKVQIDYIYEDKEEEFNVCYVVTVENIDGFMYMEKDVLDNSSLKLLDTKIYIDPKVEVEFFKWKKFTDFLSKPPYSKYEDGDDIGIYIQNSPQEDINEDYMEYTDEDWIGNIQENGVECDQDIFADYTKEQEYINEDYTKEQEYINEDYTKEIESCQNKTIPKEKLKTLYEVVSFEIFSQNKQWKKLKNTEIYNDLQGFDNSQMYVAIFNDNYITKENLYLDKLFDDIQNAFLKDNEYIGLLWIEGNLSIGKTLYSEDFEYISEALVVNGNADIYNILVGGKIVYILGDSNIKQIVYTQENAEGYTHIFGNKNVKMTIDENTIWIIDNQEVCINDGVEKDFLDKYFIQPMEYFYQEEDDLYYMGNESKFIYELLNGNKIFR